MNRKKILSIPLLTLFVLTMFPMLGIDKGFAISGGATTVYVYPQTLEKIGPSDDPYKWNNTNIVFEIRVANVSGLYGYEVYVGYNETMLQWVPNAVLLGTNQVVHGSAGVDYSWSNKTHPDTVVAGVAVIVGFLTGPAFSASGSSFGVLCWLTFKIIHVEPQVTHDPRIDVSETTVLDLAPDPSEDTILYDSTPVEIPATEHDGSFTYTVMGLVPGWPTADFTWSPSVVYVCDTVTLMDNSDPGVNAWIVSWKWTITGPADLIGPLNTQNTYFHCADEGTVRVDLNVTNNFGNWDNDTDYIEQKLKLGFIIDLYTSTNRFCGQQTDIKNVGKGPNTPCDAISPDLNFTMYAEVSWNGAPVNHVLCAFEIQWEYYIDWQDPASQAQPTPMNNQCVFLRTAETNKDGIAMVWLRWPTPCTQMWFGKFVATVSAKVQEVKKEDQMKFDAGYLITLVGVATAPSYPRECSYMTIVIFGKNIAWMNKTVWFVVTVYDDCDVPIGRNWIDLRITGGYYCSPTHFTIVLYDFIHIPQWAYVGKGKVYAGAFTALPDSCGVPYCPEKSTLFEILYIP